MDATRRSVDQLLRSRFAAMLVAPSGIDGYMQLVNRTWASTQVRARIVSVFRETRDTVSLHLLPNRNWRGFHAGQFVQLSVRIDGVLHARSFSLSAAPGDELLRITIKAFAGGRVSNWAKHRARVGDVVELSQAMGDFVVPLPAPQHLLFISAGSGITPLMAISEQLLASGNAGELTFLHYARDEVIFGDRLAVLARRHANFRLATRLNLEHSALPARPRFGQEQLERIAPNWMRCETFLCGPSSLERAALALWDAHGISSRLRVERFRLPDRLRRSDPARLGGRYRLHFARSGIQFEGHSGASLLEQAERAGLRPAHGCRMGICHTCKCKKLSGNVRNLLTEQVSNEAEATIQLCINAPVSDVVLDL
jgi:stearoyl-CoA 9-desaturase NADPH oxidoreductase